MVDRTETTQIVREAPEIEAAKLGLLTSAKTLADQPIDLPDYQVPGFSDLQKSAFGLAGAATEGWGGRQPDWGYQPMAQGQGQSQKMIPPGMIRPWPEPKPQGIGGYQPLLREGTQSFRRGLGSLDQAGMAAAGTGGQFGQPRFPFYGGPRGDYLQGPQGQGQSLRRPGPRPPWPPGPPQPPTFTHALGGQQQYQGGPPIGGMGFTPDYAANIGGMEQGTVGGIGGMGQGAVGGIGGQSYWGERGGIGGQGQFTPSGVGSFFNPYEEAVVQQTMADIGRQGDIERTRLGAQAVGAGAFGGSRQAIAEQELNRNVLEQQARAAGGLRQQGYQQASQAAQQAFEEAQRRQLSGTGQERQLAQQAYEDFQRRQQAGTGQQAQLGLQAFEEAQRRQLSGTGQQAQLGLQAFEEAQRRQQTGTGQQAQMRQQGFEDWQRRQQAGTGQERQLGQQAFEDAQRRRLQASTTGLSTAQQAFEDAQRRRQQQSQLYSGIGQAQSGIGAQQLAGSQFAQQAGLRDINLLSTLGGQQQQQAQALAEAHRRTQQEQLYEPYSRVSFLSDIYKGAPSSQTVLGSQLSPSAPAPSMFQQIGGLGAGLLGTAVAGKQIGNIF